MTDFNEAPASINVSMISPKGFNVQFTIRDGLMGDAFEKYEKFETLLESRGYKPAPSKSGGFPKKELNFIPGRVCPLDGGRLHKSVTKAGKTMIKCENNKWDFQQKKAVGCTFIEWPSDKATGSIEDFPDNVSG